MQEFAYRLRIWALTSAQKMLARTGKFEHEGLSLVVSPGVHHPAPAFGIGFAPLQKAALESIREGARVLELGTGAGFWALNAARRGFDVTATDLPHVPLESVAEASAQMGVPLRLLHSDLFEALSGEKYDAILFNPPFHDAVPQTLEEAAWCGGDVMRRFLQSASEHLTPNGALYLIIPRVDRERYKDEIKPWSVRVITSRWYPLLGRTQLLELRSR